MGTHLITIEHIYIGVSNQSWFVRGFCNKESTVHDPIQKNGVETFYKCVKGRLCLLVIPATGGEHPKPACFSLHRKTLSAIFVVADSPETFLKTNKNTIFNSLFNK